MIFVGRIKLQRTFSLMILCIIVCSLVFGYQGCKASKPINLETLGISEIVRCYFFVANVFL